jgi:hypothetical protein
VLVVLVYGVPLFLVSLVMTVTAAVSRRKTRPDFMWLAWSLFAVQMLFWLTIIVLNMRSSRGA